MIFFSMMMRDEVQRMVCEIDTEIIVNQAHLRNRDEGE